MKVGTKCLVAGCNEIISSRGVCSRHYKQIQRHGRVSEEYSRQTIDGKLFSRHELYSTWRSISRVNKGLEIVQEWKDFKKFVQDVRIKQKDCQFKRIDALQKFGPGNWYWQGKQGSAETRALRAKNMREYLKNNPEKAINASLKKRYRIDITKYTEMLAGQDNACAICKNPETRIDHRTKKISRLAVDHCHKTNKVRGLLCSKCNSILGQANDDIKVLENCILYLQLHNS